MLDVGNALISYTQTKATIVVDDKLICADEALRRALLEKGSKAESAYSLLTQVIYGPRTDSCGGQRELSVTDVEASFEADTQLPNSVAWLDD